MLRSGLLCLQVAVLTACADLATGAPINVALNAPVTLNGVFATFSPFCGSYSGTPSVVTDGTFAPDPACFAYGGATPGTGESVFWGGGTSAVDIAFTAPSTIDSAIVQLGARDVYELQYLGSDLAYHDWWTIDASSGTGDLHSFHSGALMPVAASGVRLFAVTNGGAHAVSELQVFSSTASTPEPSSLVLCLCGTGFYFLLRRRAS